MKNYYIAKKTNVLSIMLLIVLALLYIALEIITGSKILKEELHNYIDFFNITREIMLVILTIYASTYVSSLIIDRREKNDVVLETIINDVICSKDFFKNMSKSNLENLERKITQTENSTQWNILKWTRDKLFGENPSHYFSECDINVSCLINEDYIEKTIIK